MINIFPMLEMSIDSWNNSNVVKIAKKSMTTLDGFLRTGKTAYSWYTNPIFCTPEGCLLVAQKGLVYWLGEYRDDTKDWKICRNWIGDEEQFAGVIIPGVSPKHELFLLTNSDNDGDNEVDSDVTKAMCGISFNCVGFLLHPSRAKSPKMWQWAEQKGAARAFLRKNVHVLDFEPDTTLKLADNVRRILRQPNGMITARSKFKPPQLGFTLTSDAWHRSATVLFSAGKKRFIVGQDEETYFGCELKGKPDTVKGAFADLMPPEARRVTGVFRQGEWFAIPVAVKTVPAIEKCLAGFERIDLPRDDAASATHTVEAVHDQVDSGRIGRGGDIFSLGGTMKHSEGDHLPMTLKNSKWYKFVCNTAKRSVSVDGVD